jgi:hypothetical protein
MANETVKRKIRKEQNRSFTSRDFESIRSQLLDTARTYFPEKIQDFSEPSVGGMLLDFVSTVGDSLSYYLDHSFRELDPSQAIEPENIITHLRNAGVDIVGDSPSSVPLNFSFTAPAEFIGGVYLPKLSSMPIILAGTSALSFNGTRFNTVNDLDFAEKDNTGNFLAQFVVNATNNDGSPATFTVSRSVQAVSGEETSQKFTIGTELIPFREISLLETNVSAIIDVRDSDGNVYYEVNSLSDDTVFQKIKNVGSDMSSVPYYVRIIPAPYRFIRIYNPVTQLTTLRFGSGDASTLDDDIVPDPSDLSLPLYGKTVVPRFSIDPNSLLQTNTLGISPRGTTLTVRYRFGGGISNNVASGEVAQIDTLSIQFRKLPAAEDALSVRQSMSVNNPTSASGGDAAPTLEELRNRIPIARKSQQRIVTRQDLLARIYSLPNEFGRVYRAGISDNPANPMAPLLYIASRDSDGNLSVSPDSLKQNISTYLNEFRLVGDAIDILDAQVINFGVKYSIYVAENANKSQVISSVNQRISSALDKKFFNIDQPIVVDDITNVIINSDYVISIIDLQVYPRFGTIEGRTYSTAAFDFKQSSVKGLIRGNRGSIFELKFPSFDIIGSAF